MPPRCVPLHANAIRHYYFIIYYLRAKSYCRECDADEDAMMLIHASAAAMLSFSCHA